MRPFYLGVLFYAAAFAQPASAPFAGRWDLTLSAGNDVYPSWMEVTGKQGRPEVRVQLRTGNVQPAVAARMDGTRLIVDIPESEAGPNGVWELSISGGRISGTQKTANGSAKVAGVRAPELKREPPQAWTEPVALFNGKDLSGWEPVSNTPSSREVPGNHWTVKNGEITNQGKGANLRTSKTFDDFRLHVEFNIPEGENSGIYLRGRYEVQVANPRRDAGKSAPPAPGGGYRNPAGSLGSIYGYLHFPLRDIKAPGEWQAYDITLVGRMVTVILNGFKGIENQEIQGITGGALDSNEGAPGPVYFQGDHRGGIRYRNITISAPKR
jgi:hypothetical protein